MSAAQPIAVCRRRDTSVGGCESRGRSGAPHRTMQAMAADSPAHWDSSHAGPTKPASGGQREQHDERGAQEGERESRRGKMLRAGVRMPHERSAYENFASPRCSAYGMSYTALRKASLQLFLGLPCYGSKRTYTSANHNHGAEPVDRVHDVHACLSKYGFLDGRPLGGQRCAGGGHRPGSLHQGVRELRPFAPERDGGRMAQDRRHESVPELPDALPQALAAVLGKRKRARCADARWGTRFA